MAANLPPISGAIYWSNDIEKDLNLTLTVRHVYRDGRSFRHENISLIFFQSLARVLQVTKHASWPQALAHFNTFIAKLHRYRQQRP